MWFAIKVQAGAEIQALRLLEESASSAGLQELFVPCAEVSSLQCGEWERTCKPLIPGMLVAVAPSRSEVRAAIRRTRGIQDLLGDSPSVVPLSAGEAEFLNALAQPGGRTVGFSEGFIDRGRVVVQSGPLLGRESLIRRVNHRRRRAYLQTSIAGSAVDAEVGLRVVKRQTAASA